MMFEKYLTKTGRLSSRQPQNIKNQWYIQKFVEVHGSTYNYSKVEYTTSKVKVEIVCKEHGSFLQSPSSHLTGNGCPKCSGNNKKSTKECTQDFTQVHGGTYDYSKVEYVNNATIVEIICKEHGSFFQRPNSHLKGMGCPKCYGNKKKNTEECIQDFIQVHGSTYEYSNVQYINAFSKVEIICNEHGSFLQRPNDHLNGQGCPKCQHQNQDTLYILRCLNTGLIKIGITNNLKNRVISIGGNMEYITHILAENPRQLEKLLHERYKDYNVLNPTVRNGNTEFFQLTEAHLEEIKQFMSSIET